MAYLGSWKIDDNIVFQCNTHNPTNGMATDADSTPFWHVYEDESATPMITGTMALLNAANTIGYYTEQVALSAANGFEKGKCYHVYIQAVVAGVTGTMSHNFQLEAEVDANRQNWANVDNPTSVIGLTNTSIKSVADPVIAGMVTGSVLGNVNGSVASVTNPVGISTGTFLIAGANEVWRTALPGIFVAGQAGHYLPSRMPTGSVVVGTNNDKTGYSLTTGSMMQIADHVWDEPLSEHLLAGSTGFALNAAGAAGDPWSTSLPGAYGAGTAGFILGNRLDVFVSSRQPSGTVVVATNNDKTGYSLSSPQFVNISGTITNVVNVINLVVAGMVTGSVLGNVNGSVNSVTQPVGISTGSFINAIADQVWDETLAQHLLAGSTGFALNAAGAAGDPWGTALPGAYGAGTAGSILGNRLDVNVSSRQPSGTVVVASNQDKTGYSLATGTNIPANVKQINDTNITGNGSSTPWGPA